MANEKDDEILLEVGIDEGAVEARLIQLRKQSKALRDEKAALLKANKAGLLSEEAYAKALNTAELSLKATNKEIREQEKALEKNAQAQNEAAGYINQLRAKVSLLNASYDGLTEAELKNASVGGILQSRIASQTDELLSLEAATGRSQRNVGNYGNTMKTTSDKVAAATTITKDYVRGINVLGVNVGQTADSLKSGASGIGTFTKAIFTGRGALIALSAVPIVLLFTGLVTILTKTQAGMDFVAKAAGAIEAIFTVLIKSGIELTKAFVELFTSPTQAFERFKKILSGLPSEVANAAQAGVAIVEMNQKIRESERALRVERSAAQAEIEKQKKISEDVTKSQEVREAAAKAAYSKEIELLGKTTALQKQRVAVAQEELKQSLGNADALDRVADAQVALNEIQKESAEKQTELQNQLNQIRADGQKQAISLAIAQTEKEIAEAQKLGEFTYELDKKLLKQKLELAKVGLAEGSDEAKALQIQYDLDLQKLKLDGAHAIADREDAINRASIAERLAQVQKGTKEEFELRRAALRDRDNEEFKTLVNTYKNESELNARVAELNARTAAENKAIDKAERDALRANAQADIDFRLAHAKQGSRAELLANLDQLKLNRDAALDNEDLTQRQIVAIRAKYRKDERALQEQFTKQQVEKVLNVATQTVTALDNIMTAQSARVFAEFDSQQAAAVKSAGANADLRQRIEDKYAKKRAVLEKQENERKQKYAEVQALINGAVAITEASPNVLLMALAAATTLAQVAVISAQKFADGGVYGYVSRYVSDGRGAYLRGPGTGKSDSINAKLSNGESILTAKATDMFYNQLSSMNVAGGGRAFPGATATPMPQFSNFASGGVAITQSSFDASQLAAMIEVGVANALANQPPVLVTSDLHKVESAQTRLSRRVTIS